MKRLELNGLTFGRITVTMDLPERRGPHLYWRCLCECGTEKYISTRWIVRSLFPSCGCARNKIVGVNCKHGKYRTRIHNIWGGMLSRCYNPNVPAYPRYGGRGIQVCESWKNFSEFYSDMGDPPSAKHSLDRIDNDGNYCPGNCRWATRQEQSRNTRFNHNITHNGITKCAAEWAEVVNIPAWRIIYELKKGIPLDEIFNPTPK